MRSENEVLKAVTEQVIHGIKRCGWNEEDFGECVNLAMDMVMTDEEAMAYPDMGKLVKMTIVY